MRLMSFLIGMGIPSVALAQAVEPPGESESPPPEVLAESASVSAGPDIVRTSDGAMVRGTIVEVVPGDHVLVQTAAGELRRFASADVVYAGPAVRDPAYSAPTQPSTPVQPQSTSHEHEFQPPPSPTPTRGVRLRIRSDPPGLRLNFHAGTSGGTTGNYTLTINAWDPVCTAPCEEVVEPGHYRAAISDLEGDFYPVKGGLDLTRDRDLRLRIDYKTTARTAGMIMALRGYATMIGSLAFILTDVVGSEGWLVFGIGGAIGIIGQTVALTSRPVGVVER